MCRRNSCPSPLPSLAPGMRPGDVGHGEPGGAGLDNSQIRHQCGERVVGDLRPRGRHGCDQARLAGAREAHQPDVGDRLELEHDIGLDARFTEQGKARRLATRRCEGGVAEAAGTTGSDHPPGAVAGEIGDLDAVRTDDDGAVRHRQLEVLAVGAAAVAAHPGLAVTGLAVRAVVVVEQRGDVAVDDQDHVTAASPVATVRAAERLELLTVD